MNKFYNNDIDKILINFFYDYIDYDTMSQMHIDRDKINLNSKLEEFEMDSLDKVELILKIEREFDIYVDDYDAEKMFNDIVYIKDMKNILREKYNIIDIKGERKLKINNLNEANNS